MTVVMRHLRPSRLSAMIDAPGGLSVGKALVQAKANLAAMQEKSLVIVNARIVDLNALRPAAKGDPDPGRVLTQAYGLSSAVIDAAGPFELFDLCEIASRLCDLIDAAPEDGVFDWRIITVHAQSMKLIMALPPEATQEREMVMASLKQVMEHKLKRPVQASAD